VVEVADGKPRISGEHLRGHEEIQAPEGRDLAEYGLARRRHGR
jgi:hypothetical protein